MLGIDTLRSQTLGLPVRDRQARPASPAASPVSCSPGTRRGERRRLGPTDLWNVDAAVPEELLTVLKLASESGRSPGDLGCEPEIKAVGQLWRGGPKA